MKNKTKAQHIANTQHSPPPTTWKAKFLLYTFILNFLKQRWLRIDSKKSFDACCFERRGQIRFFFVSKTTAKNLACRIGCKSLLYYLFMSSPLYKYWIFPYTDRKKTLENQNCFRKCVQRNRKPVKRREQYLFINTFFRC